jgi:DNA-binding transcriptional LysR family regulator
MMPSASELKYFLEVANTLNMSRAAERLGISQPALTLAIKRLEESFGQPVLIRSKTGVRLTRSGTKLVGKARFLIEQWQRIRDEAAEDEAEVRGSYVLGCHPSVALYTLPAFVKALLKEHQGLEFKLVHDLSRNITEGVISSRIDFGLVINPVAHPDLVIKPLLDDEVTFWTTAKPSPLQDPKSDQAVLICDEGMVQANTLLKQLKKKGFNFRRVITSRNLEVITSLVASGAGIGILPARVAMKDKGLKLRPVDGKLPKFQDRCSLIYRADLPKTPSMRALVDGMTQQIQRAHS